MAKKLEKEKDPGVCVCDTVEKSKVKVERDKKNQRCGRNADLYPAANKPAAIRLLKKERGGGNEKVKFPDLLFFFGGGGELYYTRNRPEMRVCRRNGISILFRVGEEEKNQTTRKKSQKDSIGSDRSYRFIV